jgi:hypothetical protein
MNLYAHVGDNPIVGFDPLGLYNVLDFTIDAASFAAGLGNAVTFGGSTWIAEQFMDDADAALLRQTERCSGVFEAGEWASLGLGAGRLAYAGLAKGASAAFAARGATMANAQAASAFRNTLKQWFRVNPWTKFRMYTWEQVVAKHKTAEKIFYKAGYTDPRLNGLGAAMGAGGAATLAMGEDCECKP